MRFDHNAVHNQVRNQRAVALSPLSGIVRELKNADPEVQAFAIKVLSSEFAHKSDLVERFLQEARAASGLNLDQ